MKKFNRSTSNWVLNETTGFDLGDIRLNNRLTQVVNALGGRPEHSITANCNS